MKAFADGFVLIGGFLAFAAFGYYAISKLEDFLKQIRVDGDYDQQEEQGELNIAAANLCAMQVGAIVLKDMKKEHPNLHLLFPWVRNRNCCMPWERGMWIS